MTLKGLLSKAKLCDLTVGFNWIKTVTSFLLKARRKRTGIDTGQTKQRITDKGRNNLSFRRQEEVGHPVTGCPLTRIVAPL